MGLLGVVDAEQRSLDGLNASGAVAVGGEPEAAPQILLAQVFEPGFGVGDVVVESFGDGLAGPAPLSLGGGLIGGESLHFLLPAPSLSPAGVCTASFGLGLLVSGAGLG
jgi:hypothetical protein